MRNAAYVSCVWKQLTIVAMSRDAPRERRASWANQTKERRHICGENFVILGNEDRGREKYLRCEVRSETKGSLAETNPQLDKSAKQNHTQWNMVDIAPYCIYCEKVEIWVMPKSAVNYRQCNYSSLNGVLSFNPPWYHSHHSSLPQHNNSQKIFYWNWIILFLPSWIKEMSKLILDAVMFDFEGFFIYTIWQWRKRGRIKFLVNH